jgi:hypothetical protein
VGTKQASGDGEALRQEIFMNKQYLAVGVVRDRFEYERLAVGGGACDEGPQGACTVPAELAMDNTSASGL